MILLGIGGNLPSEAHGSALSTSGAALHWLGTQGLRVLRCSPWFETAPVPVSDQPWFVNAVVEVESGLAPEPLMDILLKAETAMGRVRGAKNAARPLDLDILDYRGLISDGPIHLPHPRMADRAFVLHPLRALAPNWRHPVTGAGIDALVGALDPSQEIRQAADAGGLFGTGWTPPVA